MSSKGYQDFCCYSATELKMVSCFAQPTPTDMSSTKPLQVPRRKCASVSIQWKEAGLDKSETLHSFRSGSAITLALSGSQLADVMDHVGWQSSAMALYYLKLAQVLRPSGLSDILALHDENSFFIYQLYGF